MIMIRIKTDITSIRDYTEGTVEYEIEGGPHDRFRVPNHNKATAVMEGILEALRKVGTGKELILIEAPPTYITGEINTGAIFRQLKNGLRKKDGTPIAHADMWEKILREISRTCRGIQIRAPERP